MPDPRRSLEVSRAPRRAGLAVAIVMRAGLTVAIVMRAGLAVAIVMRAGLAVAVAALAGLAVLPATATADPGAALVTGPMRARERAVVREALEDELRQAGWSLRPLAADEAAVLAACFARAQPWPCLTPLATAHRLARLVELRVEREASRRGRQPLRLTGQLGHVENASLVVDARYCSPCNDLQLATATRLLTRRLLAGSSLRDAATRLEIRTTPPGAVLRIDGRMVEARDGSVVLSPGLHTVHLQLTGYRTEMRAITVEEGKRARLEVELTPLPSRLPPSSTTASPSAAPSGSPSVSDAPSISSIEVVDPRVMPPLDDRPTTARPAPSAPLGGLDDRLDRRVDDRPGDRLDDRLGDRLVAPPAAPRLAPAARPAPAAPAAPPRRARAAWAFTLGGAALLVTGGVLIALDEDLPEGPSQLHRPRYFDSALAGLTLASAGALASATGLTLWLIAPSASPVAASAASRGAGFRYTASF